MSDMLTDGLIWLDKVCGEEVSEAATYVVVLSGPPASESSVSLFVTRGRTVFRVTGDYGMFVRDVSDDFIFDGRLLPRKPEKGDEIRCGGVSFEVLAPNDEPVWRECYPGSNSIRVHTKRMGQVQDV